MKNATIQYEDFAKLELLIGEIKHVDEVTDSKKLLLLRVDLWKEYGEVEILSGIKGYASPDELINHKFIFLANLEPKNMAGKTSHGMLIAGNGEEKPILIPVSSELANGLILC